ncbi:MAG: 30S ribosomal protein S12 methylthiotransferase RimO [Bacteroidaceae bacterium]|nr:30S ribosomal protein S12 methylthiotransferase RimO [Bacteroidaceae bacterium]
MRKGKIDVITLGCSKNLVDSEKLMGMLSDAGYTMHHDPDKVTAPVVVINTCGFIGDAQEESVNTILECAAMKEQGIIRKLYVMGCLSQKYKQELEQEIPQVDRYYGKFNWTELVEDLKKENNGICNPCNTPKRVITTPRHYAYLKIAEGCNRSCAYCAIPLMTGKYQSYNQQDILDEAKYLIDNGVKEIQLIAQDLTYYGYDQDKRYHIAELVDKLAHLNGLEWIRLHYGYPNNFPMELLDAINSNSNVCRYLDLALQHISNPVLKRMRRNITAAETKDLIQAIREKVPGIHLRTTLMVGFPGETEQDFDQLIDFVRTARFERMGAFAYCQVDGTYSALHYKDDVPEEIKQQRLDALMNLQQEISADINSNKVGQIFKTVIDRKEGDYWVGRTEFDSPEVDPEVLVPCHDSKLEIGNFYNVCITDSEPFELYGHI